MKADAVAAKDPGFFTRAFDTYRQQTGQSLALWAAVALFNLIAQIVLRRELNPGEFGTLNTALGIITLMTVPLLTVHFAFSAYTTRLFPPGENARIEALRSAALLVTETFAWIWGVLCFLLIFLLLTLLSLPRFSLQLFTLMNVLVSIGSVLSLAVCHGSKRFHLWAGLLVTFAFLRALLSGMLGWMEPWAESGLAAFLLAGFITAMPALAVREGTPGARWNACRAAWDRDFLLYGGAAFSIFLGIFLFTSADRIVAQSCFGTARNNNMGLVDWHTFDAYQTAGLLGRALVWGTQPLLWILFAQRTVLNRTTKASLAFFWIYLGALIVGAIFLGGLARPISWLFCGSDFQTTSVFIPSFAAVMVLLGLLQGVGIFALSSRRYPECFVFGACGVGYAILLFFTGLQPQVMPAYMFGGGLVSLMIVLFIGVVRWGRKQP